MKQCLIKMSGLCRYFHILSFFNCVFLVNVTLILPIFCELIDYWIIWRMLPGVPKVAVHHQTYSAVSSLQVLSCTVTWIFRLHPHLSIGLRENINELISARKIFENLFPFRKISFQKINEDVKWKIQLPVPKLSWEWSSKSLWWHEWSETIL